MGSGGSGERSPPDLLIDARLKAVRLLHASYKLSQLDFTTVPGTIANVLNYRPNGRYAG